MLVNEARKRFPSQINFHFGREATQIDLGKKQVCWEQADTTSMYGEFVCQAQEYGPHHQSTRLKRS